MKHTIKEYTEALDEIGDIYLGQGEFESDYRVSNVGKFNILEDMLEDLKNASKTVNIERVEVFDNRKGK